MDTAATTVAIMRRMPAERTLQDAADEDLMGRYATGDVQAFETLYQRHEMKVWRYVQRSVRNQAIADELMQEVWLSVSQQALRYQPTARFTTWLFTLAHNRMIDFHRASLSRFDTAAGGALDPDQLPAAESTTNPASQLQLEQQYNAVIAAVTRLPAEQREAFLLHAEAELRVEDIATVTQVSFETAKSRLRYARARLRGWLQERT
jgi:RNA polymerase sigma factor (sigma-70 family)